MKLRPSLWVSVDPIEKHSTLIDALQACDIFFHADKISKLGLSSAYDAAWLGHAIAHWLKHLLCMQNTIARERDRYFSVSRSGYAQKCAVVPQHLYEALVDSHMKIHVLCDGTDNATGNTDGKKRVNINVKSHARTPWQSEVMCTVGAVLTQLFVEGNCVSIHTSSAVARCAVNTVLQHLKEYRCVEIAEHGHEVPDCTLSPPDNTWVLLVDTWLPGTASRVARFLRDNKAQIVLVDESQETAISDLDFGASCHLFRFPQLRESWRSHVATSCCSVIVGPAYEASYVFRQSLESDLPSFTTTPVDCVQRRSDHQRCSLNHRFAHGLNEQKASVVGVNCNALDALYFFPQTPLVPGLVGNSFRFHRPCRTVLRRPFGSPTWFDGSGGLCSGERQSLLKERAVQLFQNPWSVSRMVPFIAGKYLRI